MKRRDVIAAAVAGAVLRALASREYRNRWPGTPGPGGPQTEPDGSSAGPVGESDGVSEADGIHRDAPVSETNAINSGTPVRETDATNGNVPVGTDAAVSEAATVAKPGTADA